MEFLDALWDELIVHNEEIRNEIRHRTSSRLVDRTYGAVARRSVRESAAVPTDQVDAAPAATGSGAEVLTATDEHDPLSTVTVKKLLSVCSF